MTTQLTDEQIAAIALQVERATGIKLSVSLTHEQRWYEDSDGDEHSTRAYPVYGTWPARSSVELFCWELSEGETRDLALRHALSALACCGFCTPAQRSVFADLAERYPT